MCSKPGIRRLDMKAPKKVANPMGRTFGNYLHEQSEQGAALRRNVQRGNPRHR